MASVVARIGLAPGRNECPKHTASIQTLNSGACGQESIKLKFRPLVFVTDVHSDIGRGRTLSNSVTAHACLQAEFR